MNVGDMLSELAATKKEKKYLQLLSSQGLPCHGDSGETDSILHQLLLIRREN